MRADLVDILACPDCTLPLRLAGVHGEFEVDVATHVADGILECAGHHRFPIIDEIPRLVPQAALAADERAFVTRAATDPARRRVDPESLRPSEIEDRLQRQVEAEYRIGPTSTALERRRAEREAGYLRAEYRGDNKRRYAQLVARRMPAPGTILDVGGSLPGMLASLRERFPIRRAVVADMDPRRAFAFRSETRSVDLVRADARFLPFKNRAFNLVVSAFLLEHVSDWRKALRSMAHVGERAFVAFGPNRWFPFEIGHIDAPLAGTLPKTAAALVAYAWLRLLGQRRSLEQVRDVLRDMTYISSREFRQACGGFGIACENVFPDFVDLVAGDRSAPPTLPRRAIRAYPRPARALARTLAAVGLEPNVYYLLRGGTG